MLSALSNQGIGLPVRNRKVFTSDVIIRAKANANKVTLKHDGTDANAAPSVGSFNIDVATGSSLKVRRSDITARVVTINPDSGGAGTQINSWGTLELEATNGISHIMLRGSRVVFNDAANTAPVSVIGTTDLLTVYNGGGTAIRDLKARTFYGVAQTATDIPLSITLAAAQSANAFNITSNGGTAGDIFNITSTGNINLPSNTQVIRWGTSGQGMYLRLTRGTNPQLDIRDYTNSYYARVRADTYFFNNGEYLYSDGTKMRLCKSSDYYHNLWTAAHRVYDSTAATYLSLDATASYGDINTSSGYLVLRAAGSGSYAQISSSAMYWVAAGTAMIGFMASNTSSKSDYGIGWSSGAVGTNDTQLNRRSAGAIEINNGTSGALRDIYARTVYGIAQAATDIPLVIQGAASQSANLTQWKNSGGTVIASVDSSGSITARQSLVAGYGYWILWSGSTAMTATGDGVLLLSSFGSSTANRIQFNGQTSSYPAIKRNGAGLDIRLADDSGYAVLTASNSTFAGMTVGGYSIRSTTGTALYLVGSSSGVEIGNYGTALATVKPNSANGTTSLQYFLTSNTAISEASAGVAEVNNGTAGTLRDLSARNVYSNGNPVGTGKDIYNMIW